MVATATPELNRLKSENAEIFKRQPRDTKLSCKSLFTQPARDINSSEQVTVSKTKTKKQSLNDHGKVGKHLKKRTSRNESTKAAKCGPGRKKRKKLQLNSCKDRLAC